MNPNTSIYSRVGTADKIPIGAAVIYRRVSTDRQALSLEAQEADLTLYAQRLGCEIEPPFEDEDVSGGIPFAQRTGGRLLLNRIKLGDIKHLIVSKQNRLGRDTLDQIQTIRTIWALGITPHFSMECGPLPFTKDNQALYEMKATFNQLDRLNICEQTQVVATHLFKTGRLTGNVPYGWDVVYTFGDGFQCNSNRALFWGGKKKIANHPGERAEWRDAPPEDEALKLLNEHGRLLTKELVDNLPEQGVILWISRAVQNGCKREHIALDLNKRGLKTKLGRNWQIGHVTSVLNNRYTQRLLSSAPKSDGGGSLLNQTTPHDTTLPLVPPLALLPEHQQPAHH